jgi:hypothetical protein
MDQENSSGRTTESTRADQNQRETDLLSDEFEKSVAVSVPQKNSVETSTEDIASSDELVPMDSEDELE